ncbi:uncharacterized mitochondrial protein AtMg00810-like [Argentina anserina]|uniref:uncharacterized mitochondrial protein AtMg00810-like n=1 Tax=Argentina anserina TaxID=57926 RepID=UPI0021762388|nr:uncharacterized mitochondrial protein AtMg00810-like [Potentilla anserina]
MAHGLLPHFQLAKFPLVVVGYIRSSTKQMTILNVIKPTLAASRRWKLHHLDVNNAFLHGDLSEEIYMSSPPGLRRQGEENMKGNLFTAFLIYVDDIFITGNDLETIAALKTFLHSQFHLKDLGDLKHILGIEHSDLLKDPEKYRRLIGWLIYLTVSRPDITYAIHVLSRFMNQPRKTHWEAPLRVVRYLKGAPGQGLFFSSISDLRLRAYCDFDWAGCPVTRRSTTGYFVFLGYSLVSWKSKHQKTVSLSSTEAEYRPMTCTCCELTWLRCLLKDLGMLLHEPTLLFCDNKATLQSILFFMIEQGKLRWTTIISETKS